MNRQEFEQSLRKGTYLISPDGTNKEGKYCYWIGFDKTVEGEDDDGNNSGVIIGKLKNPKNEEKGKEVIKIMEKENKQPTAAAVMGQETSYGDYDPRQAASGMATVVELTSLRAYVTQESSPVTINGIGEASSGVLYYSSDTI